MAALRDGVVPRRDREDVREERALGGTEEIALLVGGLPIPAGGNAHRQQRLDLRGEEHVALVHRIEEWLYAETVADGEHGVVAPVGDDTGELAAEMLDGAPMPSRW